MYRYTIVTYTLSRHKTHLILWSNMHGHFFSPSEVGILFLLKTWHHFHIVHVAGQQAGGSIIEFCSAVIASFISCESSMSISSNIITSRSSSFHTIKSFLFLLTRTYPVMDTCSCLSLTENMCCTYLELQWPCRVKINVVYLKNCYHTSFVK